jgi:hypothetical protein
MTLRRRGYMMESVKKGPMRRAGISGLSYRIESEGSKKYLVSFITRQG